MSDLSFAYEPLAGSPQGPRYDGHGMTSMEALPNMMGGGGGFLPPPVVTTVNDRVGRPTPQVAQMMQQQAPPAATMHQSQGPPVYHSETLWDRMAKRRSEVMKMFLLSLIVVLALSIDHVSSHYLMQYVSNGFFTVFQELMVRISYPVIVILVMWLLKAW